MKVKSGKRGPGSGRGLRIGIVVSRFNDAVTRKLLDGAVEALTANGVLDKDITVVSVPGAVELGPAAQKLARSTKVDAIICLGAVIRGETEHFTYVCNAAQQGVTRVSLDENLPVMFGVLTTEDAEQAMARAGGEHGNKGADAAVDAVEMANLFRSL